MLFMRHKNRIVQLWLNYLCFIDVRTGRYRVSRMRGYSAPYLRSWEYSHTFHRPDLGAQSPTPPPGCAATVTELPPDDSGSSISSSSTDDVNTSKCCNQDVFPALTKLLGLNNNDDDDDNDDWGKRNIGPDSCSGQENIAVGFGAERSNSPFRIKEFPSNSQQASPTTASDFSPSECTTVYRSQDTIMTQKSRILDNLSAIDSSLEKRSCEKEQELTAGTCEMWKWKTSAFNQSWKIYNTTKKIPDKMFHSPPPPHYIPVVHDTHFWQLCQARQIFK